jgi:GNAT superfamily N-acetyltransferase
MATQQISGIPKPTKVKTAKKTDEQRGIDTIVLAFSSDPVMRWIYPNPHDYLSHFPEFVRIFAGKAFDRGTAYYTEDFAAAALWLPPGVQPDEDALIELIQTTVPEERQEHLWEIFEQVEGYHPTEPYWYLPVIGADPTNQRKGSGSALMQHVLAKCDQEGTPAYLESSNPENISLYARYGFEILGMMQVGTMPPIIPMVRKPRM